MNEKTTLRRRIYRTLIVLVLTLGSVWAYAQHLPGYEFEEIPGLPPVSRPSDILQDKQGYFWFSYESNGQGLFVYDGSSVRQIVANPSDSAALPDPSVCFMFQLPSGNILMGTTTRGLVEYHYDENRFEQIPMTIDDRMVERVNRYYQESDSVLWLACIGGLVKFNPITRSYLSFRNEYYFEHPRWNNPANRVHTICQDPLDEDVLWVGTVAGLLKFNKSTAEFEWIQLPYIGSREVGLLNEVGYLVMEVKFLDDSTLVAGTWGGGIIFLDTRTGQTDRFRDPSVNPPDDIYFNFDVIDNERMWVGSARGFGIYDRRDNTYEIYESVPREGYFTRNLHYTPTYEFLQDGNVIVLSYDGGAKGIPVTGARPGKLFPPIVTELQVSADDLPVNVTAVNNRVLMQKEQKDLLIRVVSPGQLVPDAIRYRYQLVGYDRTWNLHSGPLKVSYDDLKGGNYEFRFQASLDGETWMDGTSMVITKEAPLWSTLQFKAAVVLMLALGFIGYLWISWRQRQKAREMERSFQLALAESEMAALRAQMNPHFIFNSLNSIKMHVMKQDTQLANKYLTKFSHLMRVVLRNSELKLITIADEINALELYIGMENLRFDDGFDSEIAVDEQMDPETCFLPPMLIQPYVENAIWHGLMHKPSRGHLAIRFFIRDKSLLIEIEDDGVGRHAPKSGDTDTEMRKSYGMRITRDRIELLKRSLNIDTSVESEDLKDEQGNPRGTLVRIILPLIGAKEARSLMH